MTSIQDIAKMNDGELAEFVKEKREVVRVSRFNAASRDVRGIRLAKKDIARGLMELGKRNRVTK